MAVVHRPSLPVRRGFHALLASLVLLGPRGCSFLDGGNPEQVSVRVGGNSTEPVRLIVSRQFLVGPGDGTGDGSGVFVEFIQADTLMVTPPFDRSYPLAPTYRFFARVLGPESGTPTSVQLRVAVDGNERYNQTRTVGEDFLQFLFIFQ